MKTRYSIMTAMILTVVLGGLTAVWAGDDGGKSGGKRAPDVAPVTNAMYLEECGACHFPYQPGLLPEGSWDKIMAGLDDHFGDNAELPPDDHRAIAAFLAENAANRSDYRRSRKIMRSLKGDTPLRISEVRYLRKEHDEIPARLVADNPEVRSIARCEACHRQAAEGYYNESGVKIPGYGKWDD